MEESQAINRLQSGAIIIAGSGMCDGGRIVHHLKQNLGRRGCHVLIVGFQAYGTLGRRLVNGEQSVRIHGEDYRVRAQVHTVGGLSAHADQADLLRWVGGFRTRPAVYLVHGEAEAKQAFQSRLRERLGIDAIDTCRRERYSTSTARVWRGPRGVPELHPGGDDISHFSILAREAP